MGNADAVFIAVGTPTRRGDGHADLTYVCRGGRGGRRHQRLHRGGDQSTVPVGTGFEVARIIRETQPSAEFDVCSNPEFLREGAAIEDFMKPDRVVIGVGSQRARDVMAGVYRPLNPHPDADGVHQHRDRRGHQVRRQRLPPPRSPSSTIADLCEKVGADVHDVARGIGLDSRIGRKFLHPGPGFGGSCFPKRLRWRWPTRRARVNAPQTIVEQHRGEQRAQEAHGPQSHRLLRRLGEGPTVGVLGLTFKPNTDDMRDAPSLDIVPTLQAAGAVIVAFDPEGMNEAARLMPSITFCRERL